MNYDLEERVQRFGETMISFIKTMKTDFITKPILTQLVRSATSIGANYMEANQASSKKDFRNKIAICPKEANKTKHWVRMLSKAVPEQAEECRSHWKEAHELTLIFAKIKKSS